MLAFQLWVPAFAGTNGEGRARFLQTRHALVALDEPPPDLLLAASGKAHDPRLAFAHRPALADDLRQNGRAEHAAQVAAALAPVEARTAERAAAVVERREIDAAPGEELPALLGHPQIVAAPDEQAPLDAAVEQAHRQLAGQ